MDEKLKRIYYSPKGYWKGLTAIRRLSEEAKVSEAVAKNWLSKQAIWQIYLPAPKKIIRPKFQNYIPNDTHQIDLLYLPYDNIGKKKYKYALTVVDLATRYKEAEPLTERSANAVAIAITKIYNRGPLTFPRLIQCDDGAEFKGKVNQLFLKHQVLVRRGIPGNHRSQAIVESFNKHLAERLFSYQYDREMITDRTNTEWVRRLSKVINVMNNEIVNGVKPVDAIKEKTLTASNKKVKGEADTSLFDKKVRYLYAPGEVEGGDRKRATDPIWSTRIYEVKSILETNPPVYYLREPGPQRAFVKEELQIVP